MNIFKYSVSYRHLLAGGILLSVATLSLRASENLPVETINGKSGHIASARVENMDSKVYVSGQVKLNLPYQAPTGLHVDVYLVGKDGKPLEQKKSRILVTSQKRDRTNGGRFPYAVSFDQATASKASSVRIVYCQGEHPERES